MTAPPATLADWLGYLETLHPKSIAMGLDRVRAVHGRLGIAIACPVVTVTGTNGKGSTSAFVATMLERAGHRTGLYTSPHLVRYNERVRIGGAMLDDEAIVAAFRAVEAARDGTPLTYFEFGTLAALWSFARARPDALVLEVGLGGRLDAVNVVDPDVAVLTTVALDHQDYLGPTRETIGREKAGIFRPGRPAVCGDPDPPCSVLDHAAAIGAPLCRIGYEYRYAAEGAQWRYEGPGGPRYGLPHPALRGSYQLANAATALAAVGLLRDRLFVGAQAVRDALVGVEAPGRFQVLPGRPAVVLDVAHNPHAAQALAGSLGEMGYFARTLAVFGMLGDKDIAGVAAALAPRVDGWFVAPLPGPRGASAAAVADALATAGVAGAAVHRFDDVAAAYRAAGESAGEADRIVVFGSFLTVAAALAVARPTETHR